MTSPPYWLRDARIESLVAWFIRSWEGTPYRPNARMRNLGVDCANLVAAWLEVTTKVRIMEIAPRQRDFFKAKACVRIRSGVIQSGDIVMVKGTSGIHPHGHLMIAADKPFQFLHATMTAGVCRAGLPPALMACYRPLVFAKGSSDAHAR